MGSETEILREWVSHVTSRRRSRRPRAPAKRQRCDKGGPFVDYARGRGRKLCGPVEPDGHGQRLGAQAASRVHSRSLRPLGTPMHRAGRPLFPHGFGTVRGAWARKRVVSIMRTAAAGAGRESIGADDGALAQQEYTRQNSVRTAAHCASTLWETASAEPVCVAGLIRTVTENSASWVGRASGSRSR
jgi:hypothetical protein